MDGKPPHRRKAAMLLCKKFKGLLFGHFLLKPSEVWIVGVPPLQLLSKFIYEKQRKYVFRDT